ncbi:MAG TPA: hypothetical protein ENL08_00475 [Bacteroidetes bacterium]|nr:hypothetical protein [Bacteroidota bacterium]
MTHETRRGIRLVSGILNIIIQILMLWIIVRSLDVRSVDSVEHILITIKSMLTHISIMFGSFFIYYTLVRVINRRNLHKSANS